MITDDARPQLAELAPSPELSVVAIEPPGTEPGTWSGAPSAVRDGDQIVLAYRLRRPIGQGRGYAIAIARSADGVHFQTIQVITKEEMDTESLERPALVRAPNGTWRLYLSCATWGTKHWRVELLEASAPDAFDVKNSVVVLPGDATAAVKDPVIIHKTGTWHLWASVHPLADPDSTDRMTTDYATSADGIGWTWHGHALCPRPGEWDSRGVRVSAVRFGTAGEIVAYYDGRATRGGELRGADWRSGRRIADGAEGDRPRSDRSAPGWPVGLRYLDIVDLGNGHERWYYEVTRPDGLHELRTELR